MRPEAVMRTMPVVPVAEVASMPEMMAMATEMAVPEMTAAAVETTMASMTMANLDDAVLRRRSPQLRRRQSLRGWLRRSQHHEARHSEKAQQFLHCDFSLRRDPAALSWASAASGHVTLPRMMRLVVAR